jgi:hypothetical protein
MTIEHLLAFLGYDMNATLTGRPEGVDANALKRLTLPRRPAESTKPSVGTTTKADTNGDEMPAEKPQAKTKKAPTTKKADNGNEP